MINAKEGKMMVVLWLGIFFHSLVYGGDFEQGYETRERGAPSRSWGKPEDPRRLIQSSNQDVRKDAAQKLLEKVSRQKHALDRFNTYVWCAQFGDEEERHFVLHKISKFKGAQYDEEKLDQFENDEQRRAKRKIQSDDLNEKEKAGDVLLRYASEEGSLMDTLSYVIDYGISKHKRHARLLRRAGA